MEGALPVRIAHVTAHKVKALHGSSVRLERFGDLFRPPRLYDAKEASFA